MEARIISLIAGRYIIVDLKNGITYDAVPRGVLRIKSSTPKVGDIVEYEIIDSSINKAIINKIMDRTSDLIRPCIANIDQALVVFSVKEPELNLNLLDKFLVTLEYNSIKPIIIFSKWDLLNSKESLEVTKIIDYYKSIGYECIITSTVNNLAREVKKLIKNKVSVLTGQSGVGKSSLLNLLDPSLKLETNEISEALNRGKHTTRHVELLNVCDGWIADTPGFGSLEFFEIDELSLSQNFVEFFKASRECKYNCCLHLNEPGCKVKEEVEHNLIIKSRYENYKLFIDEIRRNKK